MKQLLSLFLALWLGGAAWAQSGQPVVTQPKVVSAANASSTVAVTNTFQSLWAQTQIGRSGCTIQNNGSNTMYVFAGPIASATLAKSVKLAVGQTYTCGIFGLVLRDQISITGTATEAFYATQY